MMEGRDLAVDRISDLPGSLLTHILSFLTTEEAVQTCVLSKRWTNVWASLPVLKFDDRKFNELAVSDEDYKECEAKFVRFVNCVLNHRENVPLDTFELSWQSYTSRNHYQVLKFLRYAAKCKPRVISIRICSNVFSDLPASIFTSRSVEEMSLSVVNGRDVCIEPISINLPSLKKLELGDREMEFGDIEMEEFGNIEIDESFMTMLFTGCPLLEELVMNGCSLNIHEISSDKLKSLALNECILTTQMLISCPGVVSLCIKCSAEEGITLENMSSLVNADLCLEDVDYSFADDPKLLSGLTNVTNLTLNITSSSIRTMLAMELRFSNFIAFNNLTSLTLGELENNHWFLLEMFLKHSPNLKKLTLHFDQFDEDDEFVFKEPFARVLSCRHEHLEIVVIKGYEDISGIFAHELMSALETRARK